MKLFRAYILTVIICISISSVISCIFIADENARKISLGEEYAVVSADDINPLLHEIKRAVKSIHRPYSYAKNINESNINIL